MRKDGAREVEIPAAAKVIGILFASSNEETAECAARIADSYTKMLAAGKLLYVVYLTLDTDIAAIREAMPDAFLALQDKQVWEKLWVDLKLTASPTLVLYAGKTGQLITTNGMRTIREDPLGIHYPWIPQSLDDLLGDVLIQNSGAEANRREVLAGKHVGLLFAAQWSQPSLRLIEKLYITYKSIKKRRAGQPPHIRYSF